MVLYWEDVLRDRTAQRVMVGNGVSGTRLVGGRVTGWCFIRDALVSLRHSSADHGLIRESQHELRDASPSRKLGLQSLPLCSCPWLVTKQAKVLLFSFLARDPSTPFGVFS